MYYLSIDLTRQAIQSNGKLFSNNSGIGFMQARGEASFVLNSTCSSCNVYVAIIYQWIGLDKLYKLMESFFQISESDFELTTLFFK